MLGQLHFSLFESFFSSSCFIIESPIIATVCLLELFLVTICLSKLAHVVAELKQNLPLDHAGTVLVAVNGHFPFVHKGWCGSYSNIVSWTVKQSFKLVVGSNWITSRKRGGRFKSFVWFLPNVTALQCRRNRGAGGACAPTFLKIAFVT